MDPRIALSREGARQIVGDSFAHLLSIIQPKGRFVYSHLVDQPDVAGDGYNLLRHCGTLWFMLRAANELGLGVSADDAAKIVAAVGYAGGKLARPDWLPGPAPAFGLVTKGAVKLGGVGLALVMLQEFRRFGGRRGLMATGLPASLDETILGLENYAVAQAHDNDFLHKRRFDTGEELDFRSDYYTGEALLGLFVSDRFIPVANAVAEHLMRRDYGIDVQSHWMAYAACVAVARGRIPREVGMAYLARLMQAIISDQTYRSRRQSTPIACRTEALTRYLMLARDPALAASLPPADLLREVASCASENLQLQLDWYRGGQFWKGDEDQKVQIDYIQHNATAFLNWLQTGLATAQPYQSPIVA